MFSGMVSVMANAGVVVNGIVDDALRHGRIMTKKK